MKFDVTVKIVKQGKFKIEAGSLDEAHEKVHAFKLGELEAQMKDKCTDVHTEVAQCLWED